MDVLDGDLLLPASGLAFYVSGWLANVSVVPATWQLEVSALLVVVGVGAVYGAARLLGIDVDGGQCRAQTADGDRCSLSRGPGDDLCHVHQRTHDVELHPTAVDGAVPREELVRDLDDEDRGRSA